MKRTLKRRANRTYAWAEANVVTAIFVTGITSALVAVALVGAMGLYTKATFAPKTACTKDPAGRECAEIRLEIAKAEPLRNPCASFQRVTSRRGRNCDQFYVRQQRSRGRPSSNPASAGEPVVGSPTTGGRAESGGVPAAGNEGGAAPGPGGGGGQSGKNPDVPKGEAPARSPAASALTSPATAPANESPGNSEGNGNSESSKAKPIAEGAGKALEDVGGVVQETGKSVNEAVEGVTGKACGLVGASC